MVKILISLLLLISATTVFAQTTGTNTAIQQNEAVENQKAADRNERANTENAQKPNSSSAPTQVDTSGWGLDSNVNIEISNHLFGYSTIIASDRKLSGVKLTGLLNLAYYSITYDDANNSSADKKSRLTFGGEFPTIDITKRAVIFTGLGITFGDVRAFYVDIGLDYYLASWFKVQAGANINSSTGSAPQASVGLVW